MTDPRPRLPSPKGGRLRLGLVGPFQGANGRRPRYQQLILCRSLFSLLLLSLPPYDFTTQQKRAQEQNDLTLPHCSPE